MSKLYQHQRADLGWRRPYAHSLEQYRQGFEAGDEEDDEDDDEDDEFGFAWSPQHLRAADGDLSLEAVDRWLQRFAPSPRSPATAGNLTSNKDSSSPRSPVAGGNANPNNNSGPSPSKSPVPPTSEPPPNRAPPRRQPQRPSPQEAQALAQAQTQYTSQLKSPYPQQQHHYQQHQQQYPKHQQKRSPDSSPSRSESVGRAGKTRDVALPHIAPPQVQEQSGRPAEGNADAGADGRQTKEEQVNCLAGRGRGRRRNRGHSQQEKERSGEEEEEDDADDDDEEQNEVGWLAGGELSLEDIDQWLRKFAQEKKRKQRPRNRAAPGGAVVLPAIQRQVLELVEDYARQANSAAATNSKRGAAASPPPLDGNELEEERQENLEVSEMLAWGCLPEAAVFCRSSIAAKLQSVESQRSEQARRQRDCIEEASRRSRRKASDRRRRQLATLEPQSTLREMTSAVSELGQAIEPGNDIVRAKRLMKVLTRIRATQEPLGKRLARAQTPRKRFPSKFKKNVLQSMVERQRMTQKQSRKRNRRIEDFGALPKAEQHLLCEVFELYQDESQTVNAAGALKCLVELGLRGNTAEERATVKGAVFDMVAALVRESAAELSRRPSKDGGQMASISSFRPGLSRTRTEIMLDRDEDDRECEERFGPRDRIDIYNFAASILPVARRELYDARLDKHSYHFISVLSQSGGGVSISSNELMKVASLLDIDEEISRASLLLWAHLCERSKHSATNQLRLMKGSSYLADFKPSGGSLSSSATLQPAARRLREAIATHAYEFDAAHYILLCGEEHTERDRRARERLIQLETGLSKNLFWNWRPELCKFHDMFLNYDVDNSGTLSHDEVKLLLKRAGLQPFSKHTALLVDQVFEPLMATKVELDFIGLLNLVEKIRRFQQDLRSNNLQREFSRFDVDNSGELSHKEAIALLHASRIAPTRVEQDVAWQLIDKFDSDQSGALNLLETELLTQHIVEKIYSEATDRAFVCGFDLGFDETRITLYQRIFDEADETGAGALDLERTQDVLSKYIIQPPLPDPIAHAFRDVLKDSSSGLSFMEFLLLMKQLGEKRRMEVREAPFTLRMVPERKLRDILQMYPLSPTYIQGLPLEDLLENVSTYTGYEVDQDLRKLADPIRNPRQLLDRVRSSQSLARKGLL